MSIRNSRITRPRAPADERGAEYAVLTETNGDGLENCYYFIRMEGNEEALRGLQDQLDEVDRWQLRCGDDGGVPCGDYELDMDHPVPAAVVEEMLRVEGNGYLWCKKLDGKMMLIDFDFTEEMLYDDGAMSRRVFNVIGSDRIAEFFEKPSRIPTPLPGRPRALRNAPPRRQPKSYVVMTENDDENVNSYYFIRVEGNERVLRYIRDQLEKVEDWVFFDDGLYGAIALDLDHPLSPATVDAVMKVRTSRYIRCTKLTGKLSCPNLWFAEGKRSDEAMARKVYFEIGNGRIKDFCN